MSTSTMQPPHPALRAPREDRTALIDPPLGGVDSLLDENVRLRHQQDYDVQGRRLSQLTLQARQELLREARRYTSAYRDVAAAPSPESTERIFLAGHQPQLFHPGVWFKNFVLGYLADRCQGTAVNLVIDSDTIKQVAVPVPGGTISQPRLEMIPLDRPDERIPYEQRPVLDRDTFLAFGHRAHAQIAPLVPEPLVDRYWPLAAGRLGETDNLGECLAQSRHQLEGQLGLQTLEIPQGRVCDMEPFCWFTAHLLAQLARLRDTYNRAVREYRRAHHIRSPAHPVPDLAAEDQWLEAPLWIWTTQSPVRRRLFARPVAGRVIVADRHGWEADLPLGPDADAASAVQRLMDWNRQGVKIRSRALITTLWARLVLGDLFLHGIGGAKYDQVTDLLMAEFFGVRPPGFMVVSATLRLPLARPAVSAEDAQTIQQHLRELTYHAEQYLDPPSARPGGASGDAAELIAEKHRWIHTPVTPDNARRRWQAIGRTNEARQPWVAGQRQRWLELQTQTAHALRAERILASREYPFCLYPEATFREFVGGVLPKTE